MPEGPMNIEPVHTDVEVETNIDPAEAVEKQQTGLTDVPADATAVPAGTGTVHFPTPQPRLYPGGQRTLKALRGQ